MCLLALFLSGCGTPRISREGFDRRVSETHSGTVNAVYYMGSDANDHYLRHISLWGEKIFRIPREELILPRPFSLTEDRAGWRRLKTHTDGWPPVDWMPVEPNFTETEVESHPK